MATRDEIRTCCTKHFNDKGRVNLVAAHVCIRQHLKQPLTKGGESRETGRFRTRFPSSWKKACPLKQGRSHVWTSSLDNAVDLFIACDNPIRKALGLPRVKPEVPPPKKKVVAAPIADESVDESESGDDADTATSATTVKGSGTESNEEGPTNMECFVVTARQTENIGASLSVPEVEIAPSDDVEMEAEAPVILNKKQAENVNMDQTLVRDWENATAPHYIPDREMVYVPHVLADLFFKGNTTSASTAMRDWHMNENVKSDMRESLMSEKDKTKLIFEKVKNPNNPRADILACKPLDLLEFLLQCPAAKRFGLTRLSANTLIRKLGGDPSLHAEIDANARASEGTSVHRLARSEEVGSSADTLLVPTYKPRRQPFSGNHCLYLAYHNGFVKPGITGDIVQRDSHYSPGMHLFLLVLEPDAATIVAYGERKIFEVLGPLVAHKHEYLDQAGVLRYFEVDPQDPALKDKVAYKVLAIGVSTFHPSVKFALCVSTSTGFRQLDEFELKEFQKKHGLEPFRFAPKRKRMDEDDLEFRMQNLSMREETKRMREVEETRRIQHKYNEETKRTNYKEGITAIVGCGDIEMLKIFLQHQQ